MLAPSSSNTGAATVTDSSVRDARDSDGNVIEVASYSARV
jgi:hypothetical protein